MIEYDLYLPDRIAAHAKRFGIAVTVGIGLKVVEFGLRMMRRRDGEFEGIFGDLYLALIFIGGWSLAWAAVGLMKQWALIQELTVRHLTRRRESIREDDSPSNDKKHASEFSTGIFR